MKAPQPRAEAGQKAEAPQLEFRPDDPRWKLIQQIIYSTELCGAARLREFRVTPRARRLTVSPWFPTATRVRMDTSK